MNGAFAIPGPPVILYVIATMTEATQSRAFLMMFFWCSSIVSLAMFALAGLVTPRPFQLLWWRCQRCGWAIGLEIGPSLVLLARPTGLLLWDCVF